ncbi:MAG: thrombospondin type 3 repeat-containing protein, partial [Gemmatimonadetes bacterium]|nr:thrombospondin type 3 repeat-containing protein [Gemmatimonadota bacterium]
MDGVLVRLEIQGKLGFVNFPGQSTTLQISTFINAATGFPQGPSIKDSNLPSNSVGDYDLDGFVDNVIDATLVSAGGTCTDTDGDGVPDSSDNCPTVANAAQTDTDGDGQGDACDIDDDGDGIVDTSEAAGCELDPDCDNDNVSDGPNDPDGAGPIVAGPDNCVLTANTDQTNTNGDAQGDAC